VKQILVAIGNYKLSIVNTSIPKKKKIGKCFLLVARTSKAK
jgi:hypothetical protein